MMLEVSHKRSSYALPTYGLRASFSSVCFTNSLNPFQPIFVKCVSMYLTDIVKRTASSY